MRMLRNAIAHGHVIFSSDERDITQVNIRAENYKSKVLTWRAKIGAPQLNEFCRRFIQLIDDVLA